MPVLDDSAFASLTADRRRELHIHCYRMLASDAEAAIAAAAEDIRVTMPPAPYEFDGRIAEITTFGPTLFPAFGLPPVLV